MDHCKYLSINTAGEGSVLHCFTEVFEQTEQSEGGHRGAAVPAIDNIDAATKKKKEERKENSPL